MQKIRQVLSTWLPPFVSREFHIAQSLLLLRMASVCNATALSCALFMLLIAPLLCLAQAAGPCLTDGPILLSVCAAEASAIRSQLDFSSNTLLDSERVSVAQVLPVVLAATGLTRYLPLALTEQIQDIVAKTLTSGKVVSASCCR